VTRSVSLRTNRRRVIAALACAGPLAALLYTAAVSANQQVRRCARCDGAIVESLKVVVTDFAGKKESLCCNVACAIAAMDKLPTARAVARDPFAGKEVRIIRTGAKWVAWPTSAVFLFLPQTNGTKNSDQAPAKPPAKSAAGNKEGSAPAVSPASKPHLDPPQRCLAFPRQVEYVQYLATHPEVAALKPRPLRLGQLLAAIKEQKKDEPPAR
jgi:hypothetical protein